MLKGILVGNLGADAEVKSSNGKSFVSFKVADSRTWEDAQGVKHEETTWVSCAMNGDGGKVLPYLKKGVKVMCVGRESFDVYSSPKDRRMKAGVNMFVESVELVGGQSDDVPRHLYTSDGVMLDVFKAYPDIQKKEKFTQLQSERGDLFSVDPNGFLMRITSAPADSGQQEQNTLADSGQQEQNTPTDSGRQKQKK